MHRHLCCCRSLLPITTFLLAVAVILGVPHGVIATDIVVVNANVITIDKEQPTAEAFAIVGDQFVEVGSNEKVKTLVKPETKVIDLRGMTVVPGFNDAHIHPRPIHPPMSRLGTVLCDPVRVGSMEELIDALKAKAEATPKGEWVIGTGYQDTKLGRHPTRWDLDKASTEHPIYIGHSSGHIGVSNSLALQLAKVDASTADPRGGAFDRDDANLPNGILRETAQAIVREAGPELPVASTRETIEGYRRQFAQYLEKGLTSIQIAGIDLETMRTLQAMRQDARPLRIYVMLRNEHLPDLIELNEQQALGNKYFRLGAVKRWFGNSLSGRTCLLYKPYADRPDYFGIPPRDSQQEINDRVREIHDAGFQACIHANGDREIDMLLDAYEAALKKNPRVDHRHRIEHCSVVNEGILHRIKKLGIVLATHSYVYEHGDKMEAYGETRWNMMHPNRSAIEMGIPVAGNSDGPVSTPHPMLRIQSMVTRESAEGKVYGEKQRVTVDQAIRVWTLGSAYASYEERTKGSVTPGKLADFVVLRRDPREVDADELQSVLVEQTFIGGKLVFDRRKAAKTLE
jgi:predicted amidohydrolase YtcJ